MERIRILVSEEVVDGSGVPGRNEARIDATYRAFLKRTAAALGVSADRAQQVLVTVIGVLCRRLPVDEMADLASQLPIRLRELLASEDPAEDGLRARDIGRDEFLRLVAEQLGVDLERAHGYVAGVFRVLAESVSKGEIEQVIHLLPRGLRALWPPLDPSRPA